MDGILWLTNHNILPKEICMIRQLAHICFFTDQVDKVITFYRDGLGLPVKFTLKNDAGEVFGYYLECGHSSFIEVFDQVLAVKQWGGQVQKLSAGSIYKHLCFEVTGLEETIQTLAAHGIQVGPISLGMDHSRQAWTADPDGNAIELMEYTHASLQLH
jgi:lactoylglutathione lyase